MTYTADTESLRTHPLPAWYSDAKLGIFVHWTAATIPAYAPVTDDPFTLVARGGWELAMRESPYVEWYQNSLSIPGSSVAAHHAARWPGVPYDVFVERFRAAAELWDPAEWVDLAVQAGAGYLVFVTKHHDGVTLWPSHTPNPWHGPTWSTRRDCVGELAAACRSAGLRFGTYYSGGLDWTFGGLPIDSFEALIRAVPRTPEYARYVDAHWRELIDRYGTDVLWHDIAYPRGADGNRLTADFYNRHPDGIVNDRLDIVGVQSGRTHADIVTPEYASHDTWPERPFEVCRGIGHSFGYNAWETDGDHLDPDALVAQFVDVVAAGGNLLLNLGPTATGEVPAAQASRVAALGRFVRRNREALIGSRPWHRRTGRTADGLDVRFTARPDRPGTVYATVLGTPTGRDVALDVAPPPGGSVRRLGDAADVSWVPAANGGCVVTFPVPPPAGAGFSLRLDPPR
jgi:alpha-L-fucosidase